MGVGRRNVFPSYIRVGGCLEECVSLVTTCRLVSGGMCYPRTYVWVGIGMRNVLVSYLRVCGFREECVSLLCIPRFGWVSG